MGVNSMLPFLKSLCCNSPWNYAVFWKLKCQDEMILVWEDGFCEIMNMRDCFGNSIEDFYLESSNKISSNLLYGAPGEYPIRLAVAEMSSASHVVGKGVVGEAAFTGNPRWIYSENTATDMFGSNLASEYPDEWLLQFIAGIKTIMLLPVLPHGVLQLGSVEMVNEDATLVDYAKQKFEVHKRFDGFDTGPTFPQFSLMSTFTESFDEPNEDQKATHYVATQDQNLFAANQKMSFYHDCFNTTNNICENVIANEISQQDPALLHLTESQFRHPSWEDSKSEITENNILESSTLDEKVPYFDNFEFLNELMDFLFEEGAIEPNSTSLLNFPMEREMHKVLGSGGVGPTNHIYDSSILDHDLAFSSINGEDLSAGFPLKEDDIEHFLDTVLTYACNDSDDSSKNQPEIASSLRVTDQSKRRAPPEEGKGPWSFSNSRGMNPDYNFCSKSSIDYQRKGSRLSSTKKRSVSGEDNQRPRPRDYNCSKSSIDYQRKGSRLSTKQSSVSCVDNQRPRPRDRQLIQDRIKELRGLVPNTEKCSIDGLLDKTIKHMLFLRSVTDQADKLRPQVLKEESDGNSELNRGTQCGTSWAVEIGSEQQPCPIIVKDLDQPGQMLIEMLCSDHGRFLEITDVIHRLQLTILKAVMEKCSENSWARFIVEASGSFQRLDIFWPLMQLLQTNPASNRKQDIIN